MTMRLGETLEIRPKDFDPGATALTDVAWVSAKGIHRFAVMYPASSLTTSATIVKILGNTAADGSGTDHVLATAASVTPDDEASGDYIWVEVTGEDIAATNASILGVSAQVSVATATDEATVIYIIDRQVGYTQQTVTTIA